MESNRARRASGTFNANPLSAAAGCACLDIVAEGEANASANRAAKELATGMNRAIAETGARGCVYGAATILHVLLGADCLVPEDGITWRWTDTAHRFVPYMSPEVTVALKRSLINEGVDLMSDGRLIVGAAHTAADIESTIGSFRRALVQIQSEGLI